MRPQSTSDRPDSLPVNNGTKAVWLSPYTETSVEGDSRRRIFNYYQTISAQYECLSFSLEELRLADYEEEAAASGEQTEPGSAMLPTQALQRLPRSNDKTQGIHLALLTGPAIDIQVGSATSVSSSADDFDRWSLPKRLITHHSPFLAAACDQDFKERRDNLIKLPDDDPTIFALFVEWLYYGDYGIQPFSLPSSAGNDSISVDAECWVLGDKLQCYGFKNCAMRRLYKEHTAKIFSKPITAHNVQFACDYSAESSKLRKLYVDLAATYFGREERVLGTIEEWDKLVVSNSDLRRLLLQSLRLAVAERNFVESEECYLEHADLSL